MTVVLRLLNIDGHQNLLNDWLLQSFEAILDGLHNGD
jgi:hypothetical protein